RVADGLPKIDVTYQDLVEQTRLAWKAIQSANDERPFLFRRGTIVRIERTESGLAVIREVTPDRMRHAVAPHALWFRPPSKRSRGGPARPPMSIVRDLLATPDPPLPALLRVVEAPAFAPDGTLHTVPGYNTSCKAYYAPALGLSVPVVPGHPSASDVRKARDLILEMVEDFPFTEDSERAHAIALFVLPFVRSMIDGPTPLHLIEKPSPGTGATLLVETLAYAAIGR